MKQLYIILFTLYLGSAFAQTKFTAHVNQNSVTVNSIIKYEISSNENCQIYQPDFGGLQVVGGPFQSTSSQFSNINGVTTQSRTTTYTYQLRGQKKGNYTISAAQMDCNGKVHKTESIKINVTDSPAQGNGQNKNSDFYIRVTSSKKEVFQGEPFVLTLKMFSKKQPQGIEALEEGSSTGIIKTDLNPNQTQYETKTETINGMRYYTTILKQQLCYAQVSNKITIEPYYISALFRKGFFQQYRQETTSNKVVVTVKKKPGVQPKDFNGLVGEFDMTHSISKTTVKPGEAIDLNITISGKGNLDTFDEPKLDLPNDFDQFDPEINDKISTSTSGISGSISFNYVLVPTFYGDFNIPAYTFSYFDVNTKKYNTLSTDDFNIHVDKPDNAHGEIITQKKDIKVEETDIRYIHKSGTATFKNEDIKSASFIQYILITLPFLGLWLILYLKKKRNNMSDSDKVLAIKKKAKKTNAKYLQDCKTLHKNGKDAEANKALSLALKRYLKDKFNLTESDLSLNKISEQLNDEELKVKFKSCWNKIEMYQYAPVNTEQIDVLINDTEDIINQIDKQV